MEGHHNTTKEDLTFDVKSEGNGHASVMRTKKASHTNGAERILLSKAEAAQVLGEVSPSTLDRLRRDAGLPCVKLNNGLVLSRPESLKAWAAAAREAGEAGR